jgi:hypothetical protein
MHDYSDFSHSCPCCSCEPPEAVLRRYYAEAAPPPLWAATACTNAACRAVLDDLACSHPSRAAVTEALTMIRNGAMELPLRDLAALSLGGALAAGTVGARHVATGALAHAADVVRTIARASRSHFAGAGVRAQRSNAAWVANAAADILDVAQLLRARRRGGGCDAGRDGRDAADDEPWCRLIHDMVGPASEPFARAAAVFAERQLLLTLHGGESAGSVAELLRAVAHARYWHARAPDGSLSELAALPRNTRLDLVELAIDGVLPRRLGPCVTLLRRYLEPSHARVPEHVLTLLLQVCIDGLLDHYLPRILNAGLIVWAERRRGVRRGTWSDPWADVLDAPPPDTIDDGDVRACVALLSDQAAPTLDERAPRTVALGAFAACCQAALDGAAGAGPSSSAITSSSTAAGLQRRYAVALWCAVLSMAHGDLSRAGVRVFACPAQVTYTAAGCGAAADAASVATRRSISGGEEATVSFAIPALLGLDLSPASSPRETTVAAAFDVASSSCENCPRALATSAALGVSLLSSLGDADGGLPHDVLASAAWVANQLSGRRGPVVGPDPGPARLRSVCAVLELCAAGTASDGQRGSSLVACLVAAEAALSLARVHASRGGWQDAERLLELSLAAGQMKQTSSHDATAEWASRVVADASAAIAKVAWARGDIATATRVSEEALRWRSDTCSVDDLGRRNWDPRTTQIAIDTAQFETEGGSASDGVALLAAGAFTRAQLAPETARQARIIAAALAV